MKLKYYLQGLGVGIILTTLILMLSGRDKMSEEEIRREALKLGMVEKEEKEDLLEEVLDHMDSAQNEDASNPPSKPVVEDALDPDQGVVDPAEIEEGEPNVEGEASDEEAANEPAPTEIPAPSPSISEKDEISFTIKKGMSSNQVSIMLEDMALVEKAKEFNNFIQQRGKANVIRVGTFTVPKGASYEELLNAITSR